MNLRRVRDVGIVILLLSATIVAGCNTPVGVRHVGSVRAFRQVMAQALSSREPSYFSVQAIAAYGLENRFESDPKAVLAELFERARQDGNTDAVFALAELSFLVGHERDDKRYFFASAFFAYLYLFHPKIAAVRQPFDPRFRIACDLYNHALTEALRTPSNEFQFQDGVHSIPFGRITLEAKRIGMTAKADEFAKFLPATDFVVRGLRSRYRNPGLGVPLIAVRTPPKVRAGDYGYLPDDAKVATTAFLRFDLTRDEVLAGRLEGTLELYASFHIDEIEVEGERVPLEADLTAPVAYLLQEGRLFDFELSGFLSGKQSERELGMFMLQPYAPGKIPVVFVHGTASSPARWAEMFNSLQQYPDLREKYQFAFFQYATGNPILYSSHLLREELEKFVRVLDPEGKDPALEQMVVIGHSQGGLLTRMQATDSGDRVWKMVSDEPFESLDIPKEEKDLLRKVIFFDPLPFVKRVIFVSTPHRGSFHSGTWYGRLAGSLVSLPSKVASTTTSLFKSDPSGKIAKRLGGGATSSIRGMDPEGPLVKLLESMPLDPSVKSHSIIPIDGNGKIREEHDGVVEYTSAHLDGVESEFLVYSPHSCQDNPLTIIEVRRILREHLAELSK